MSEARFLYVHRDDMRRWQLATLEVQQALQSHFEKAGIAAWCGGGTLIGAVRNNGFLYWDNDLDMFFQHQDYKRILISFWEHGFLNDFEIFYNVEGYWERHYRLNQILTCKNLDEKMLDFELAKLSKTMMKIFRKKGVPLRLHRDVNAENEEFVKIKHFVKHHLTRHRLAYLDDGDMDFNQDYVTLPNVCMLPMVNIKYSTYFFSNIIFLFYRIICSVSVKIENVLNRIVGGHRFGMCMQKNKSDLENNRFDPTRIDPVLNKVRLASRRIYRMTLQLFSPGSFSKKYIAYRQAFFRFEVMPYPEDEIFPLKKLPFEGVQINVPNNHTNVLKIQFGDYQKVPPLERRFGLPFFIKGRI